MASQKMALLAVAAGLLCMSALLNGAEASCGGFTASCQEPFSVSGSVVSANCKNDAGVLAESSLDLDPFLGNDNGNLVEGSDYIATCTPEGFAQSGSSFFIYAHCAQEGGNPVSASYDINNNVSNDNGVLAWHSC
ncbi:hypothetical protein CY35_07G033200 [Sphagnum magellanicum]|uniref:Uncharacterized protein n=2 Tax=Sphagnum magellanicum TaxID=128215 RepID=A0ACB8HJX4_9BRYO|nr:hypothetical protein CY35_07G033100 [Sphagnum magellanicum]KAH9556522.1 hypothetical protein CY35_07G033200 [Sphagnum magellanicum]